MLQNVVSRALLHGEYSWLARVLDERTPIVDDCNYTLQLLSFEEMVDKTANTFVNAVDLRGSHFNLFDDLSQNSLDVLDFML